MRPSLDGPLLVANVERKLRNFNTEQQELALTFGFNI
jgi:hypothetical protein